MEHPAINVTDQVDKDGFTVRPLYTAATQGAPWAQWSCMRATVKRLAHNVDVNQADKDGRTPLFIAANLGRDVKIM